MYYFFNTLLITIKKSFSSYYGIPHIAAVVLTYVLVMSNFDWWYFTHMREKVLMQIFFPAIPLGGVIPIIVPLVVIAYGVLLKKKNSTMIGWALAQAMILASFISSLYKALTGRVQPNVNDLVTNISHEFNFGIYNHGIFWGWPSSHTTIAFAMATTLIFLFPKNKKIIFLSLLYAFYIGIGISFSIHWFSDFIAGVLIGTVIGITVGRNFKQYLHKEDVASKNHHILS